MALVYGSTATNLDFQNQRYFSNGQSISFDNLITFSRGSQATIVDSRGYITYAPNNLILYSEEFDNAYWTKDNSTITANSTVAPNGTLTADTWIPSTSGVVGTRRILRAFTVTPRIIYTLSVYVKSFGRRWVYMTSPEASSANNNCWFDLQNGVVGTRNSGVIAASISPVDNGWYRISTTSISLGVTNYVYISSPDADNTTGLTANGTDGLYVWGVQVEAVTYQTTPSEYRATTTASYYAPRFDYDPITLQPKGLLIEEQRTNIAPYSSDVSSWAGPSAATVTSNIVLAPDGTTTADKIIPDTSGAGFYIQTNATLPSISTYTASVYLKAAEYGTNVSLYLGSSSLWSATLGNPSVTVNLVSGTITSSYNVLNSSIQNVGGGWYRVTFSQTNIATGASGVRVSPTTGVAGDGTSGIYVWGAQLEIGSFATSYIPTGSASVQRNSDVANITAGNNFASFFNLNEGTVISQFDVTGLDVSARRYVWAVTDSGNNRLSLRSLDISTTYPIGAVGVGSSVLGLNGVSYTANVSQKVALAYGLTNSIAQNGTVTGTNATPSAIIGSGFYIGASSVGGYINGHIASIKYYNKRLPDAQLQALTA